MAPITPLGRKRAIELVRDGQLPITFGTPHPMASVVQQEGKFRIRQLIIDQVEAEAATAAAKRARSPSWMPEHYYALGKPTGTIYVEAASRAELIDKMAAMAWPNDW